ncbi:MAG TPA: DUF1501 domain-containing protein [Devosiaceae bacterium]|jgi:uncharacterized protein (DUF1501 family)
MDRNALLDAMLCPSRRVFLASAGAFVAWASMPKASFAGQARDPRFIAVILRGAMDGLAAVPPVGDPDYPKLRGDLAIGTPGLEAVLGLDGMFGLNNAMPKLHARYKAGEALMIHAAATAYRDRSHFDGQDVLESGMTGPRASKDGWLNRVAAALPQGDRVRPVTGLAAMPTVPLILRGDAPTLTWTPPNLQTASADTMTRLLDLYTHEAPDLYKVLSEGVDVEALAKSDGSAIGGKGGGGVAASFVALASGSAKLIAADDGPRLAAISYDGWDTHANEGADSGRLSGLLAALDDALDALATQLQPVWKDTAVVVMTEFGRTARTNGNEGTDHGTGTTAFLLGGAVKGGRVLADWPGLGDGDLYQDRDLKPTTDLRGVLKGVLRDHLGVEEPVLTTKIFPDSIGVRAVDGLIV